MINTQSVPTPSGTDDVENQPLKPLTTVYNDANTHCDVGDENQNNGTLTAQPNQSVIADVTPNELKTMESSQHNHEAVNCKHLSPPSTLSSCDSTVDATDENEFDEIGRLFESKSKTIERWLRERAPSDVLIKIHAASDMSRTPKSPKLRTSSVTSDLFQQWLASSPIQVS